MTITKPNSTSSETVSGRWRVDPQRSRFGFRVRLLRGLVTVTGHFEKYDGRLDLSADPAIELSIEAASVQTGNRRRDHHLRSSEFFDAENHPRVRFTSASVALERDMLKVRGWLSASGRSIPLILEAQIRHVGDELEVVAATTAPHRELGMTWSPFGVVPPQSELVVDAHLIPVRKTAQIPVTASAKDLK